MPALPTTQHVYTVGEVLTASTENTYVGNPLAYLGIAGASLASATTITVTNEFHLVTGTTTIDSISGATVVGQRVRLVPASGSPITIRNNGGGTGNIRPLTGADAIITATEVAMLYWDGTVWRLQRTPRIFISAMSGGPPASPVDGDIWIATGVAGSTKRWAFVYDTAEATYKWKFIGGSGVVVADYGGVGRQNTVDTTWQQVAGSSGLSIQRAGFYQIEHWALLQSTSGQTIYFGVGTAVGTISYYVYKIDTGNDWTPSYNLVDLEAAGAPALSASSSLILQMESTAHLSVALANAGMRVTPIKVI